MVPLNSYLVLSGILFSIGTAGVFLRRNLITGATCAARRSLLQVALPVLGGFWHDEWLALVAASCNGVVWASHALTDYRLHGGNAAGVDRVGARATLEGVLGNSVAFQQSKAGKLETLAAALRSLSSKAVLPEGLAAVEAAAAHWRARARRPRWGDGRLGFVLGEGRKGNYRRFGAGWRSALRDLF